MFFWRACWCAGYYKLKAMLISLVITPEKKGLQQLQY
jgi:hypothetical protein